MTRHAASQSIHWLARCALCASLVAAPWVFGGVLPSTQPLLAAGVFLGLGLWLIGLVAAPAGGDAAETVMPAALLPIVGLLLLGGVQQLPLFADPVTPSQLSGELSVNLPVRAGTQNPASIDPTTTRYEVARYFVALCAFLLGAQLFRDRHSRSFLFALLVVNGLLLTGFGIWQRLTWNGQLFWTVPLRDQGQPFASFVNRNNAACYLNICLGACVGLMARQFLKQRSASEYGGSDTSGGGGGGAFGGLTLLWLAGSVLMLGVACSLSRGGIVSMAAAGLLTLVMLSQLSFGRVWLLAGFSGGLAALAIGWLGLSGGVSQRVESLGNARDALGLRLSHWSDTLPAVFRAPWLGNGVGTYRLINPPFQRDAGNLWFLNADNQYFEVLVEAGAIGLLLVLGVAAVLWLDCRRLWRERHLGEVSHADLAVAGTFAFTAILLQTATDSGISISGNLLTAAVLGGSIAGTRGVLAGLAVRHVRFFPIVLGRAGGALLALGVAVAGASALSELHLAGKAYAFRDSLPRDWSRRDALSAAAVDARLDVGERLAEVRRDDARLHQALANLWMFRYRLAQFAALRGDSSPRPEQVWSKTSADTLFEATCRLPEATRAALRETPILTTNLAPAVRHLRASLRCSPWLDGPRGDLCCLELLDAAAPRGVDLLREEIALRPSQSHLATRAGLMAYEVGQTDLATACWRRAMESVENPWVVLRVLRMRLSDADIVRRVLPNDAAILLDFGARTSDAAARTELAKRLRDLPPGDTTEGEQLRMQAEVAILESRTGDAIDLYLSAVRVEPLRIEWRLALTTLLESQERWSEAAAQLSDCVRLMPSRADLRTRLEAAVEAGRRRSETRRRADPGDAGIVAASVQRGESCLTRRGGGVFNFHRTGEECDDVVHA